MEWILSLVDKHGFQVVPWIIAGGLLVYFGRHWISSNKKTTETLEKLTTVVTKLEERDLAKDKRLDRLESAVFIVRYPEKA